MKKRGLVPVSILVILSMLISTTAYAWTYSVQMVYYSDSGFTDPVGVEFIPGICCPEDERHDEGDIDTNYRIITFYYECGWQSETGVPNCQSKASGTWQLVPCS